MFDSLEVLCGKQKFRYYTFSAKIDLTHYLNSCWSPKSLSLAVNIMKNKFSIKEQYE